MIPTQQQQQIQQNAAKNSMRESFENDNQITKTNQLKVTNQWRQIMRMAKTEALKKDMDFFAQSHEQNVDRKDAILQMLLSDLEEAEEQRRIASRSHSKNIDSLIGISKSSICELENAYQHHLQLMEKDYKEEMVRLNTQFVTERNALYAAVEAIDDDEEKKRSQDQQSFEQQREELRTHAAEETNILRITLDGQIENLEQQFEIAHLNYMQQTGQRTQDYKNLAQSDKVLSEDIEKRKKKIDSLQMLLLQWRGKSRQLAEDSEERARVLRTEKRKMQTHYQQLKLRIKSYRDRQHQRLAHLSSCAKTCEKQLREKLEVAQGVMAIGRLTEDPLAELLGTSLAATSLVSGTTNQSEDRLEEFYGHYNQLLLETQVAEKERDCLRKQADELRNLLAQYDNACSLQADCLDRPNTLLIVNGRIGADKLMLAIQRHTAKPLYSVQELSLLTHNKMLSIA